MADRDATSGETRGAADQARGTITAMARAGVRRPRYRRADVPNFSLTDRDIEILKIVARHRFIRSREIIALLRAMFPGTSEQQVLRRLSLLFHSQYLSRPRAQQERYRAGGGSDPMLYALGNAGSDLLADKFGFRRSAVDWTAKARTAKRGEIEHALEVTEFMVALELACRARGTLRVIYLDEILATVAPPETRANPRPYFWPVTVQWRGRETVIHPIPDKIFGIQDMERPEGRNRKFFFLEADRGTMPAVRFDLTKTSYLRKLLSYAQTYRSGIHAKAYGFSNIRVLTVAPGRKRIESIAEAYRAHAARLCPPGVFLFAARQRIATGDLLDDVWTDANGRGCSIVG